MFNLDDRQIVKVAGFIKKLYKIVNTPEYSDIICWGDDGKSVKIFDFKELENKVLQQNFRHRNYHSFIRQLNMYGFNKMQRNTTIAAAFFTHPLFKKNCQDNLIHIKTKHEIKRLQLQEREAKLNSFNQKKLMENLEERRKQEKMIQRMHKSSLQKVFRTTSENIFRPLNLDPSFSHSKSLKKQNQKQLQNKQNSIKSNLKYNHWSSQASLNHNIVDVCAEDLKNQTKSSNFQLIDKSCFPTGNAISMANLQIYADSINGCDPDQKKIGYFSSSAKTSTKSYETEAKIIQSEKQIQFEKAIILQNSQIPSRSFQWSQTPCLFNNQTVSYGPQTVFYSPVVPGNGYFPIMQYPSFGVPIAQQIVSAVPQMCYQTCKPLFLNNMF